MRYGALRCLVQAGQVSNTGGLARVAAEQRNRSQRHAPYGVALETTAMSLSSFTWREVFPRSVMTQANAVCC